MGSRNTIRRKILRRRSRQGDVGRRRSPPPHDHNQKRRRILYKQQALLDRYDQEREAGDSHWKQESSRQEWQAGQHQQRHEIHGLPDRHQQHRDVSDGRGGRIDTLQLQQVGPHRPLYGRCELQDQQRRGIDNKWRQKSQPKQHHPEQSQRVREQHELPNRYRSQEEDRRRREQQRGLRWTQSTQRDVQARHGHLKQLRRGWQDLRVEQPYQLSVEHGQLPTQELHGRPRQQELEPGEVPDERVWPRQAQRDEGELLDHRSQLPAATMEQRRQDPLLHEQQREPHQPQSGQSGGQVCQQQQQQQEQQQEEQKQQEQQHPLSVKQPQLMPELPPAPALQRVEDELLLIRLQHEHSFIRPLQEHSFIRPVQEHSFVRPVQEHSFIRPVQEHSFIRPLQEHSFIRPLQEHSFIRPLQEHSFIRPHCQRQATHQQQSGEEANRRQQQQVAVVTGEIIDLTREIVDLTLPERQQRCGLSPSQEWLLSEPWGQIQSRQNNVGQRGDQRGQQRRYLYKYIVGVRYTPAGDLEARVQWEPSYEPLSAVPPEMAEPFIPELRVPQALPNNEPHFGIKKILGHRFTSSDELEVLVDWEDTFEPLSNLEPEHARQLEYEMRLFRYQVRDASKHPLFRPAEN